MRKIKGITWRTFLLAVSIIFLISIFSSIYIGVNMNSKYQQELKKNNSFQAEKIAASLHAYFEQIDRLAVGIGVSSDAQLFFSSAEPEQLLDGFYERIKNTLSAYSFSMKDTTDAFMLYSWKENRFISNSMSQPSYIQGSKDRVLYSAEWLDSIIPLANTDRSRVTYMYRARNNSYPYLMTLIHQLRLNHHEGVIAVDIDLSKLYSAIAPDLSEQTSIWVLSKDGQVIVTENKTALVQNPSEFDLLQFFDTSAHNQSNVVKVGINSFAFSQIYLDDWEMYVVVATELGNIDRTLLRDSISMIAMCFLVAIVAVVLIYVYTYYSSRPMRRVLEMVRDPKQTLNKYPEENDPGIREAAEYIISQLQQNNTLLEELEKRMVNFRNTQLQALKAQINPHFLFNTLNSIVMLLNDENIDPQAAQITMNLSEVLRFALSDENLALLRDELENCKKYTQIHEVRYGGKFHYEFDIDERLLDVKVPRLVLQPLVENAIFHGLSAKEEDGGKLTIRCYAARFETKNGIRDYACIEVSDNGIGMAQEKVDALMQTVFDESISMQHIGVANVARRLHLLYPTDSGFEIKSVEGTGTTISLTVPMSETK